LLDGALLNERGILVERYPFKEDKPDEPTSVIARQLENFMLDHTGEFD
jgi:hypothetical protein